MVCGPSNLSGLVSPTHRQTLWKRVQGAVTPLLASVISCVDRDGNLELLVSPHSPSWARDLWMFIFRILFFVSGFFSKSGSFFKDESLIGKGEEYDLFIV